MHRLPEKLLAVLLSLLLGIAPLRGLQADPVPHKKQGEGKHHVAMVQEGVTSSSSVVTTLDCEQSTDDNPCANQTCSGALCALCGLTVPSSLSLAINLSGTPDFIAYDNRFVSYLSNGLFRPPRT